MEEGSGSEGDDSGSEEDDSGSEGEDEKPRSARSNDKPVKKVHSE